MLPASNQTVRVDECSVFRSASAPAPATDGHGAAAGRGRAQRDDGMLPLQHEQRQNLRAAEVDAGVPTASNTVHIRKRRPEAGVHLVNCAAPSCGQPSRLALRRWC